MSEKKRKKFKDTKVGQFLLEKIPSVVGTLAEGTPAGNVVKALIGGSDLSAEDKDIALKKLDQEIAEFDGITQRWVADSQGSVLTKNVRPLTLLFLTLAFVVGWYLQIEELEVVKELLTIVFLAYFGGRSLEKTQSIRKG